MRVILAVILALTLTVSPVAASETDIETIDETVQVVIDARKADEGYEAALAELYAVYTDPVTPAGCRPYTDAAFAAFLLIDLGEQYPDSLALPSLFEALMRSLPTYRNDCLLAV